MEATREDNPQPISTDVLEQKKPGFEIEEFSIIELEDRLEFLDRCNPNCSCC